MSASRPDPVEVQRLFEQIVELPEHAHNTFLAEQCSDPEMRRIVERLLGHYLGRLAEPWKRME